jgi:5-methyltetrahydrofolate--homocysteine methyltransferase
MTGSLREALNAGRPVLLDGGMGTSLYAAGIEPGIAPDEWNLTHPDVIRGIHRAYIEAGSQVILTNTFGGNRYRLRFSDLGDRVADVNRIGAQLAGAEADAADHNVLVAGSMGPTGELMEPYGALTSPKAKEAFAEQAAALVEGGVDLLWIETMSDLDEVQAAVQGARSVCDLEVAATMSFETRVHTMMGVSPAQAIERLRHLDLVAIGANCGTGSPNAEQAIEAMRAADPTTALIAKPNAGLPQESNGEIIYSEDPSEMARHAQLLHGLGAGLIGGCCGSTPAHLRAIATALGNPPAL